MAGSVLAIGLVLTACGGGGGNGEADKSANQILADAVSALRSAKSFHMEATSTGGSPFELTLDVVSGGAARGKLTSSGASADLVATGGKVYLRGQNFFAKSAGPQAAAVIGDRWVIVPSSADISGFQELLDTSRLAYCLQNDHGTISKGGTGSVGGQAAVILVDKGDKPGTSPGKLFVAAGGTPYPLELAVSGNATPGTPPGGSQCGASGNSGTSGGTGTFFLSRFDESITVTPPPNPLDLSTLGG